MRCLLVLIGLCLAAPAGAQELRIHGNWVLPEEVYRAVVDLPPEFTPDEVTAERVSERLTEFLRAAGYALAAVQTTVAEDGLDVTVDEGRVEKVVFHGKLTVKRLRFKLALPIPHDVYNRLTIEREAARLSEELGIEQVRFELIPTRDVAHFGPQLESLPTIKGHALIVPRRPYELHVYFGKRDWNTGLGVDVRTGSYDGLLFGLHYQGSGLVHRGDRWRAAGIGGGLLRTRLHDEKTYPAFSRGQAELRWYTPALLRETTRPFVWLQTEVVSRQRPDLDLESYFNADLSASLDVQVELVEGLATDVGGGIRRRYLFGLRERVGAPPPDGLREGVRVDPFVLLRAELVFDTQAERWDRRHELVADGRYYFTLDRPSYVHATYRYRKVFDIGWHDLWLQSRGVWLQGDVPFHDEDPLGGEHLRGVFRELFVKRAASASMEMRWSITRDLYKLGVFGDFGVFGELDRIAGTETARFAVSFGPGFHALIEGMLQLDVYAAFGFTDDGRFDRGATVALRKVF